MSTRLERACQARDQAIAELEDLKSLGVLSDCPEMLEAMDAVVSCEDLVRELEDENAD